MEEGAKNNRGPAAGSRRRRQCRSRSGSHPDHARPHVADRPAVAAHADPGHGRGDRAVQRAGAAPHQRLADLGRVQLPGRLPRHRPHQPRAGPGRGAARGLGRVRAGGGGVAGAGALAHRAGLGQRLHPGAGAGHLAVQPLAPAELVEGAAARLAGGFGAGHRGLLLSRLRRHRPRLDPARRRRPGRQGRDGGRCCWRPTACCCRGCRPGPRPEHAARRGGQRRTRQPP